MHFQHRKMYTAYRRIVLIRICTNFLFIPQATFLVFIEVFPFDGFNGAALVIRREHLPCILYRNIELPIEV